MNRKAFIIVVITYFAALLFAPMLLWMNGVRNTSIENSELSKRPTFELDLFLSGEFTLALSRFIIEQNPIRPIAIQTSNWLNYHLFRDGLEGKVLQGKDGWLFYQPSVSRRCPSSRAFEKAGKYVKRLESVLRANNQIFLVSVAPNKHAIYPEFSSIRMRSIESCALEHRDKIRELMSKLSFSNYVDAYKLLEAYKSANPSIFLYHAQDTHWTNYSAALFGQAVLARSTPKKHIAVRPHATGRFALRKPDLSKMLGLSTKVRKPEFSLAETKSQEHTPIRRILMADHPNVKLHISKRNLSNNKAKAAAAKRTIIIHDSFIYPIWQSFANHYQEVLYVHWDALKHVNIVKTLAAADVVIIEVVERNASRRLIADLAHHVPIQGLADSIANPDERYNEEEWRALMSAKTTARFNLF